MVNHSSQSLHVELVTPEELLFSGSADMVVIPGVEGDFGVLYGHAPFVSSLRPGIITIHAEGAVVQTLFVAGGFAEVSNTECTILAQEAAELKSLNPQSAENRLQKAKKQLEKSQTDQERLSATTEIAIAEFILELCKEKHVA